MDQWQTNNEQWTTDPDREWQPYILTDAIQDSFVINDEASFTIVITVAAVDSFTLNDIAEVVSAKINVTAQDQFTISDLASAGLNFAEAVADAFTIDDYSVSIEIRPRRVFFTKTYSRR